MMKRKEYLDKQIKWTTGGVGLLAVQFFLIASGKVLENEILSNSSYLMGAGVVACCVMGVINGRRFKKELERDLEESEKYLGRI